MLNKELMIMGSKEPYHAILTVGFKDGYYGYKKNLFGTLNRVPYWGDSSITELVFLDVLWKTMFSLDDRGVNVGVSAIGYNGSVNAGSTVSGDIFGVYDKIGDVRYLVFDPTPTVTSNLNSQEHPTEESVDAQQGITDDEQFGRIGDLYSAVSGVKSVPVNVYRIYRCRRAFLFRYCDLLQQDCEFKRACRRKSTYNGFIRFNKCTSTESASYTYSPTERHRTDRGFNRSSSIYRNRSHRVNSEEALYA